MKREVEVETVEANRPDRARLRSVSHAHALRAVYCLDTHSFVLTPKNMTFSQLRHHYNYPHLPYYTTIVRTMIFGRYLAMTNLPPL
jgi:hypothetical protein